MPAPRLPRFRLRPLQLSALLAASGRGLSGVEGGVRERDLRARRLAFPSRLVVLAAVGVLAAAAAAAQPIRVGARIEYASTTFTAGDVYLAVICCDSQDEFDARGGFGATAYLVVPVAGRLWVQPEIGLAYRGARQPLPSADSKFDFRYLELATLGRFRLFEAGPVWVTVEAGPTLGLLLRQRLETRYPERPDESFVRIGLEDMRRTYLGVAGGGSVGVGPLSFGVRYARGVTPFADVPPHNGDAAKHVAIGASVGYVF